MCIDAIEVCFGIANGQISSIFFFFFFGVVGCGKDVYLMPPGCPTDIGLHLGKASL